MNALLHGLSGKFGDVIVFKTMRGRTFATKPAVQPTVQSAQQKENRSRFRLASQWAKSVLLDPERKAYYRKKAHKLKLPNAYTAAVADYMRPVRVTKVKTTSTAVSYLVDKKRFAAPKVEAREATGQMSVVGVDDNGFIQIPRFDLGMALVLKIESCGQYYELALPG
jgi:hypothetical protein